MAMALVACRRVTRYRRRRFLPEAVIYLERHSTRIPVCPRRSQEDNLDGMHRLQLPPGEIFNSIRQLIVTDPKHCKKQNKLSFIYE